MVAGVPSSCWGLRDGFDWWKQENGLFTASRFDDHSSFCLICSNRGYFTNHITAAAYCAQGESQERMILKVI